MISDGREDKTGIEKEKLTSPGVVKGILEKHGVRLNRSIGQHLLVDSNYLQKIVAAAQLDERDMVIEVGAGIGTLTEALAGEAGGVLALELDTRLMPILRETVGHFANLRLLQGDALEVNLISAVKDWRQRLKKEGRAEDLKRVKVVSNLPYNITSPLLVDLLQNVAPQLGISKMILMVQREVADRLVAGPGESDYGSLSVFVQFYGRPHILTEVPPTAFFPRPRVGSALIDIVPRAEPPVAVEDESLFFAVVRAAFNQRRKMLRNALADVGGIGLDKEEVIAALGEAGIDPKRRGETLSIEEFARISDVFESKQKR